MLRLSIGYLESEVRKLVEKVILTTKPLGSIVSLQRLSKELCLGRASIVPSLFKLSGFFDPLTFADERPFSR